MGRTVVSGPEIVTVLATNGFSVTVTVRVVPLGVRVTVGADTLQMSCVFTRRSVLVTVPVMSGMAIQVEVVLV